MPTFMMSPVQDQSLMTNQTNVQNQTMVPSQTMVQMQWVGCSEQPILACNVVMGPVPGMQAVPGMPQAQAVQHLSHSQPAFEPPPAPQFLQAMQQPQPCQQVDRPTDCFAQPQAQFMWEQPQGCGRTRWGDEEVSCDRMRWGDDDATWCGHAPTQPKDLPGIPQDRNVDATLMPPVRGFDAKQGNVPDLSRLLIGGQAPPGRWGDASQRGSGGNMPFSGMDRPRFQQERTPLPLRFADILSTPGPGVGQKFFSPQERQQCWERPSSGMRSSAMEQRQHSRRSNNLACHNELGPLGPSSRTQESGSRALQAFHQLPGAAPLDTMKVQLQALQLEDPDTVFIARRINKLGFSSSDALREYFSGYGKVTNVHVSHSRVKNLRPGGNRSAESQWRLRPAALGFVVMASTEATARILEDGPEHCVKGVNVRTQPFHHQPPDAVHINQEANVASIVDEPQGEQQQTDENEYLAWAKEQPRSLSPGSDSFDTGTFDRLDSGGGSTSTRATSSEGHGGAAAFLQEAARCRRLEEAGTYLQANQPPPFQQQVPKVEAGLDCQKAVESEMEMLYNNFVMRCGPNVYNAPHVGA